MTTQRFLTQRDAADLAWLAEQKLRLRDVAFNFAEDLVHLLSTAILLSDNVEPSDYVGLNSKVAYRVAGSSEIHFLVIVVPSDKNTALRTGSVITPLALALIGSRVSDIVPMTVPGRRTQMLEILSVTSLYCVAAEPL